MAALTVVVLKRFQRDIGDDIAQLDVLCVESPRGLFGRKHVVGCPTATYQQGVNSQVEMVLFLDCVFRSKGIKYELEIGYVLRRLFSPD